MTDERTGDVPAGAEAVLAAGAFAIAWFLPVVGGYVPEHAGPPGWDAFLVALGVDGDSSVLGVTSALTNGLMVAALALLLRPRVQVPPWMAWAMVGAVAVNSTWAWPPEKAGWLRAGYWLWEGAFGLVAVLMLRRTRARKRP